MLLEADMIYFCCSLTSFSVSVSVCVSLSLCLSVSLCLSLYSSFSHSLSQKVRDAQSELIWLPKCQLTITGDIFASHNWKWWGDGRVTGTYWVNMREATKHNTIHNTTSHHVTQSYPAQTVNSIEAGKPCFRLLIH